MKKVKPSIFFVGMDQYLVVGQNSFKYMQAFCQDKNLEHQIVKVDSTKPVKVAMSLRLAPEIKDLTFIKFKHDDVDFELEASENLALLAEFNASEIEEYELNVHKIYTVFATMIVDKDIVSGWRAQIKAFDNKAIVNSNLDKIELAEAPIKKIQNMLVPPNSTPPVLQ